MKYLFGKETTVGQKVVIIEPYYHNYVFAEVIKITPKGVRVKYKQTGGTYKEKDTCVWEWVNVPEERGVGFFAIFFLEKGYESWQFWSPECKFGFGGENERRI